MLKKNLHILWTFSEPGIMLQHMPTNNFFELNEVQERIWSFVDGTHSREHIITKMIMTYPDMPESEIKQITTTTIDDLLENKLINQD